MAKQRGIHQISGKINNLCYYEQKYVRGGLIRRINEAMSERLKTDPVFKNTRHANTIFGGCSMFAGALLGLFGSRNTYLFKPYRQSLLTRAAKNSLLSNEFALAYPEIGTRESILHYLPIVVDNIVKNKLSDFFPGIPRKLFSLTLESTHEFVFSYNDLVRFCSINKCIGVSISISSPCYLYGINYDENTGKYSQPDAGASGRGPYYNWYLQDEEEDLTISASTGEIDDAGVFWIVYATPILRQYQNRPVFGETGACCGIVTFRTW